MKEINQKLVIRILRIIMPIVAVLSAVIFVPWNAALAVIAPLPVKTVAG